MGIQDKVSTGIKGFDQMIDKLRLGDNVVWQVESVSDYKKMVEPYAAQAKKDNRRLVYIRFGRHKPLFGENSDIKRYKIDAKIGFESFATKIHNIVEKEGERAFYVFDCLSDLLDYWYSDLMIGNFFKVTCPFLYELDTIAYFCIIRNAHTFSTIAGIRETTQLLLNLYKINEEFYIHPIKVWKRYSATMFFPHMIKENEAVCVTASAEAAELFANINRDGKRLDYYIKVKEGISLLPGQTEEKKKLLMAMLIGRETRMVELCDKYFELQDLMDMASREIGSGQIGGKSVGMLIARKILEKDKDNRFKQYLEPHDSYYIGSDVFYTYIVQNEWWELRSKQKTEEGYFKYAKEFKEKIHTGKFPEDIQEQFVQMLEYFGQSPIIVRSSSLLEDSYGNAFAGKYDSVFCVNQGTPQERYDAFEQAVKYVYASIMNDDALAYRMNRGLFKKDEQMAILVQRVSGDYYEENFFPHIAGVGNSSNLYVWDSSIDMEAGMLRLVFGLGTRAVGRTIGDYAIIVSLDDPARIPLMDAEDQKKFSQHEVDVLSLKDNVLTVKPFDEIAEHDLKVDIDLFASPDYATAKRLRELGYADKKAPYILSFKKLLENTQFPALMKDMLAVLSKVYDYPVDIEFTANFTKDNNFKVNLVQCRPLQTTGLGKSVKIPKIKDDYDCFFHTKGNFMGGNVRLPIDYVVYVDIQAYLNSSESQKHAVARQIGHINLALKDKNTMLMGPGRWGTTTPSLGVPVNFSEICNMSVICEMASKEEGFMPELSYGSHFFQDLVETGIFYIAIFEGQKDVMFNAEYILEKENVLHKIVSQKTDDANIIRIADTKGMELFSDIVSQNLLCK